MLADLLAIGDRVRHQRGRSDHYDTVVVGVTVTEDWVWSDEVDDRGDRVSFLYGRSDILAMA